MIGNIVTASVTIQGTRPMMWHAFNGEALQIGRKERGGVAGNDPDEWRGTVLFDSQTRQLFIYSTYIFGCLREAAKYTRQGRGTYQTRLAATLQVSDERIFIKDRYLPVEPHRNAAELVYIDSRGATNPTTKGKNLRHRITTAPGWSCDFTLVWDRTIVPVNVMEAVIRDGGSVVGVGNGRNIGMGRFKLVDFIVIEKLSEVEQSTAS